jgi:hypothetical protein
MTTEPLQLSVSVSLGEDALPEELDDAARRLRQELLDAGLEEVELAEGGPVPTGAKPAETFILGALTLTLLPSMLTTLAAVVQDWTGRRPGRTLKLAYSTGDQRFELEYDPEKVDLNEVLARLVQTQAGSGAMAAPANVGGDMIAGDKVSNITAEGDAVGRDKVTHIHAAPGTTIIVNESGAAAVKPASAADPAPPGGAAAA